MAVSVTIAGTNRIAYVKHGSVRIKTTKQAAKGTADFTLINLTPAIDATVVIADGATTYFDGYVRQATITEWKPGHWSCAVSCQDEVAATNATVAPFGLTDRDAATTYTETMDAGSGLISWWRLGEAAGTDAADETNTHDGTYVNTPTLGVAGAFTADTAVTFNGSSEYVDCGAGILAGRANFTIAAWFKTSYDGALQTIYSERNPAGQGAILLRITTDGRPSFVYRDNAGTTNSITPASGDWADGDWHHAVATKLGTYVVIYVDGLFVQTGTLTASDTVTVTDAFIGADASSPVAFHFNGSLDEVSVWGNAISADVMWALYAARDLRRYASCQLTRSAARGTTYTDLQEEWAVKTWDAGLAAGQVTGVSSVICDLPTLEGFLIDAVSTTWPTATAPLFELQLIRSTGGAITRLEDLFP